MQFDPHVWEHNNAERTGSKDGQIDALVAAMNLKTLFYLPVFVLLVSAARSQDSVVGGVGSGTSHIYTCLYSRGHGAACNSDDAAWLRALHNAPSYSAQDDNYAEFDLWVDHAGAYDVTFDYASATENRYVEVFVNGYDYGTTMGQSTGGDDYTHRKASDSITVQLQRGLNTLRITDTNGLGFPNIAGATFSFRPLAMAAEETQQGLDKFDFDACSSSNPGGVTTSLTEVECHSVPSVGLAHYDGRPYLMATFKVPPPGRSVSFSFPRVTNGRPWGPWTPYWLRVLYAGVGPVFVYVNNEFAGILATKSTGGWGVYDFQWSSKIQVELRSGPNVLRLDTALGAQFPYLRSVSLIEMPQSASLQTIRVCAGNDNDCPLSAREAGVRSLSFDCAFARQHSPFAYWAGRAVCDSDFNSSSLVLDPRDTLGQMTDAECGTSIFDISCENPYGMASRAPIYVPAVNTVSKLFQSCELSPDKYFCGEGAAEGACVEKVSDGKSYCMPVCSTEVDCNDASHPGLRCFVHRGVGPSLDWGIPNGHPHSIRSALAGAASELRVCNDAVSSSYNNGPCPTNALCPIPW